MSTGTTHSTCPIVRRETAQLFEQVRVGGALKLIGFEQELIWVRESESEIVVRHRGQDVKKCATLNDFYGFLTSLESAIQEDAAHSAKRLLIDGETELCVCVDVKILDNPVLEDDSQEGRDWNKRGRRKQYRVVGDDWFTSSLPVPSYPDDKYPSLPRLKPMVVIERQNIYTTIGQQKIGVIPADVKQWIEEMRSASPLPLSEQEGRCES